MPCGNRPLVKEWDKPKTLRVIKPSRYEQNEASVKVYWKNVIRNLELSYKDETQKSIIHIVSGHVLYLLKQTPPIYHPHSTLLSKIIRLSEVARKANPLVTRHPARLPDTNEPLSLTPRQGERTFWKSQGGAVRELVGPKIFNRITKIFNLTLDQTPYEPRSETSLDPSELFYQMTSTSKVPMQPSFSMSDFDPSLCEDLTEEVEAGEKSETWNISSSTSDLKRTSRSKSIVKSKSLSTSKSITKSLSNFVSKKSFNKSSRLLKPSPSSIDEPASTLDDLKVQISTRSKKPFPVQKVKKNPHFEMLYCNKSETDMIKWNSKYKQKSFEVSASDEFSKRAEILTKKIAKEFFDWWVDLGNVEFKSEIKRPEDIEDLFQVWFDEHASRGIVLDPKILPCVLQSIADSVGVKKASCPKVLKRQIAFDIHAETSPPHFKAFGTCLPQHLKHIPPKNNTKETWHCVKIPEDLRSMACVWDDIQHLTSTKSFHEWLQKRPHLAMPPFLKSLEAPGEKKLPFVVPSDYVVKLKGSSSTQELALPISEFSLELKEVLSRFLNE